MAFPKEASLIKIRDLVDDKVFGDWYLGISKGTRTRKLVVERGIIKLVKTESICPKLPSDSLGDMYYGEITEDDIGWYVEKKYKPKRVFEGGVEKIISEG